MESYFDRMFCRTTCNEYKFTTGQAYKIHRLRNATTDPMVFIMDDDGDSRTLDLDSDDFEYIPPITYRDVDDFMAEHDDEDDDYD